MTDFSTKSEPGMRIDKWLWVARFFKSRSSAKAAVLKGRVQVNGVAVKPAKEVVCGDLIAIKEQYIRREYLVQDFRRQRGPAKVAQTLYEETTDSVARTREEISSRKTDYDTGLRHRPRPSKADRRTLARLKRSGGRG